MPVRSLAVVGTGLIGASVALAARRAGVEDVRGYDPDEAALAGAVERGAVEAAGSLAQAVGDAELTVVAAPVARLAASVAEVLEASSGTVTDVGSTKGAVVRAARSDARFIGGHPVCGSEARGPENARAELFDGATWFLTPVAADRSGALPHAARVRGRGRCRPRRGRSRRARSARRADEPSSARARQPARQPGGGDADRRTRAARRGRRLAARHDARRRREPAHLDRHLPRQRRRGSRVARRAPSADRAARGRARLRRRGLPRALDRRGFGQPAAHARGCVRGSRRASAPARARAGPSGRARRDHAGARRGADQHRGLRAPPHVAGARRRAHACSSRARSPRAARPSCSRRRATASSSRRWSTSKWLERRHHPAPSRLQRLRAAASSVAPVLPARALLASLHRSLFAREETGDDIVRATKDRARPRARRARRRAGRQVDLAPSGAARGGRRGGDRDHRLRPLGRHRVDAAGRARARRRGRGARHRRRARARPRASRADARGRADRRRATRER